MVPAMTRKDPSGPIIPAAFTLDTTHGAHPCPTCRQFVDPTDPDRPSPPEPVLDFAPGCTVGAHWFMMKRTSWQCSAFQREPGDQ